MKLIYLCVALIFLSLTQAEASGIPDCRLDNTLAPAVTQAAMDALRGFEAINKKLGFERVIIAPAKPNANDLTIELVLDAEDNSVDKTGCFKKTIKHRIGNWVSNPDAITVSGVCYIAGQNAIRCSADALRKSSSLEFQTPTVSATLLYVMAHELSHLRLGHLLYFNSAGNTLNRAAPLEDKYVALEDMCGTGNTSIEIEADIQAAEILSNVLQHEPYRQELLSPRASLMSQVFQLRASADSLEKWPLSQSVSGVLIDIIETLPLPASNRSIEQASHKIICETLKKTKGYIRIPVLRSSHPDTVSRLKSIADMLEKKALYLSEISPDSATQPLPPSMHPLIMDVSDITLAVEVEYIKMYKELVKKTCALSNAWRLKGYNEADIFKMCH